MSIESTQPLSKREILYSDPDKSILFHGVCKWFCFFTKYVGKISSNSTKQLRDVFSDNRTAFLKAIDVSGNVFVLEW